MDAPGINVGRIDPDAIVGAVHRLGQRRGRSERCFADVAQLARVRYFELLSPPLAIELAWRESLDLLGPFRRHLVGLWILAFARRVGLAFGDRRRRAIESTGHLFSENA